MAFIDKKDPVVLNIKLTSKGRELLSKGELTFKHFAIGDSEMDYEFNRETGFNPFNANILRPADRNPQQLSFITKNRNGDSFNEISAVPCTPTIIENSVPGIGFFNENATQFLIDTDHVKQPDAMVAVSAVTGGTHLKINKAQYYQANPNEPAKGDLLLVKWTNPKTNSTTGYTINKYLPTPYLWYKVQDIVSGSLAADNLVVEVDRELPNFGNLTGLTSNHIVAGAMFFHNYINYTGDSCFSTDETDDAVIAFLQNCQCPTVTFPFWNMSIIYTENILGVNPEEDKSFGTYNSVGFGGFVSYIQNQNRSSDSYKRKLGVIHYTNNSVANTYGEGFYGDPTNEEDVNKIPRLDIPTIMWHKSTGATMGIQLRAVGKLKYLTGATKSLNSRYYDLVPADKASSYTSDDVVGKVFYGLKIFVIEDQELLFAMSYKSNRSWTLPDYGVDVNANVTFGCPACNLTYSAVTTPPSVIGGSDGKISIVGIENVLGDPLAGDLILEIVSGPTGQTGGTQVYFNKITGNTTITNENTINGFGLSAITYTVRLIDLVAGDCIVESEVHLNANSSTISVGFTSDTYTSPTTYNALIPYFHVSAYASNPVRIRILSDSSSDSSVGTPLGTAYVTIGPTGMTNTNLANRYARGEGTSANEAFSNTADGTSTSGKWVAIPEGGYLELTNLTFKQPYAIYVRDATGDTFTDLATANAIKTQVWTYYVAVIKPFVSPALINVTKGTDSEGTYVTVSNFTITPDATKNPLDGLYEASVHIAGEDPLHWVSNGVAGDVSPIKIRVPNVDGTYTVTVRERRGYIETYRTTSTARFYN